MMKVAGPPEFKTYFIYGLRIKSEIEFPEMIDDDGVPDLCVRRGAVVLPDSTQGSEPVVEMSATSSVVKMVVPTLGRIRIRDGREISVDAVENSCEVTWRYYVMGPAMAVALYQRGLLVLHGSSVLVGDCAVAFLGGKGAGKSTTAMQLQVLGIPMLSDDIVAVELRPDSEATTVAGPPLVRLSEQTLISGNEGLTDEAVRFNTGKRSYIFERSDSTPKTKVRLARVYLLEDSDDFSVETIPPGRAVVEVAKHLYLGEISTQLASTRSDFELCSRLIDRVKVATLRRPKNTSVFTRLIQTIRRDLVET
jgi:hypothetical protein